MEENTNVETKVDEKKEVKEVEVKEFDLSSLSIPFDSIEKVFSNQHGRVIKDFNNHCRTSMRVPTIVSTMIAIESYKILKDIRNLLVEIKAQGEEEEFKEVEKKGSKKKIDLK